MPIYTLRCCRCAHASEQGFTVNAFVAQKERGFTYITCPRCQRRGTMSHDFVADVKTQSTHSGEYTFAENAPEDHLVGQTVSKTEAKRILKKHGLIESVKEGKRDLNAGTKRYTQDEIVKRWTENRAQETDSEDKQVDTTTAEVDTIVSKTWPALKKQAKELGIKVPITTKRPELERLVRESLTT